MNNNNFCVIMAGGVGSRFWPLSTAKHPKQFLDVLGCGKSLIRLTFERLLAIAPQENFYVVTNKTYKDLVLQELPELTEEQVLLEPARRNTAPCIQYANYEIKKRNEDARIIVAPSDHIILNEAEFTRTVNEGMDFVSQNDALLTLGIKPSRPDTGYGYIQANFEEAAEGFEGINKVKVFTEKPEYDTAKFFVESGEFFWNAGIFIWSLKTIEEAFKQHLTSVYDLFNAETNLAPAEFIEKTYAECPNISIDYGVMEKAQNVYVFQSDFGWSDLGTWGSLFSNTDHDESNNSMIEGKLLTYDTSDSIIRVPKDKLAVVQGLEGYIVVDSGESLLICKKEDEQKIRQFVNDIKLQFGEEYV